MKLERSANKLTNLKNLAFQLQLAGSGLSKIDTTFFVIKSLRDLGTRFGDPTKTYSKIF